jgi:rare lipoprotein A
VSRIFSNESSSSTAILVAAITILAMLTGCSSQPAQRSTDVEAREAIVSPERSKRGNPPVYEVFGERYFVLETSAGYHERGVASWYGEDFHGLSTSGGEPYDMYALTAAHKSLPIPTWVEVTHVGNGRRVIVKVNDRGPFVDDRIIDLSYAAAESIGMTRAGTALVEVRALGEPARVNVFAREDVRPTSIDSGGFSLISSAAAATPAVNDVPMRRVYAQVGAFSEHDNALRLVGTLKDGGYDAAFIISESDSAGVMHRVRIGPLPDLNAYDDLVEGLSTLGLAESRLIVE